jgi:DNA-binding Lrp family transcriptional regulator
MVRVKVCPCFRLSEYEELLEPVANRPWDAWHLISDGKRFIMNYESNGIYNYLKHLLHSPMCREYAGLSYTAVLVWFRRLEELRQHFIQHVFTNPQGRRREPNGKGIEQEVDRTSTVKTILHIFVEPGKLEDAGEALAKMPEIIDVYEVTGEYDIITTAKANDLHRLRSLISERLMKMHGVKAVTTFVVLHTYKLNGKEVFE